MMVLPSSSSQSDGGSSVNQWLGWEVREGLLEEVNVKCKGLWDWRVCGGVEEFLEKCSLVSQAIVEEPPREAVHWEVTEHFF